MSYYIADGNPASRSRGVSSLMRDEFTAIETGFSSAETAILARAIKAGDTYDGAHDFTAATLTAATQVAGDSSGNVATTAFVTAASFSSVLPGQSGNSGKFLTTDGSNASWGAPTIASLSGTLAAANGGTGYASYAIGDILYSSGTTALSKLAAVATGSVLLSGGVTTAPAWGKVGLTTHISGTLGAANGGTGVSNNAASTITISGAHGLTMTLSADTSLVLPTAGTLVTQSGADTLTNKTIDFANNTLTGVASTSTAQTLTNKTLTTPVISTISNTGTLTLPTTTDTIVGRATTDTLTNKTLTDPTLSNSTLKAVKAVEFYAEYDNGNSGTTKTVTMANGQKQKLTLTGNVALTLDWTGAVAGMYQLRLIEDATGSRSVTYTAGLTSTLWLGGTSAPAINTAASGQTVITMWYAGSGTVATCQSSSKVGAV